MATTKTKTIPARWLKLFAALGGYDPVSTAAPSEWFDVADADRACRFFPQCLQHIEGKFAGHPFELRPEQKGIVGCIFGWKRADGTRRYREVFIAEPRGNGKTPLAAGISNYLLFCDGEAGIQGYTVACDIHQAAIAFKHLRGQIDREPALSSRCKIHDSYRTVTLNDDQASVLRVESSEAPSKHGQNPHFYLCDEVHAWQGRALMEAIETSFSKSARRQPLLICITTRDFDRPSVCNEKWEYAENIRKGLVQDSAFLPVIFAMDRGDDWTDERVWEKANPGLDITVDRASLRRMCEKAKGNPSLQNSFIRLHLNGPTEQDMRVIPLEAWDSGVDAFTINDLRGMTCFGGLDLASTSDLCSFSLLFPLPDDECRLLSWSWCPEERVKARAIKRVPYDQWARDGWLTPTTGNETDYSVIRADICALRDEYDLQIQEISYDAWGAAQLVQTLAEADGFVLVKTPQTLAQLSAPTKEMLRRIKAGKLRHDGNPLLRWAASNMAVHYQGKLAMDADLEDLLDKVPIMPSKQKSADKIDPIAATVLAFKSLIAHPETDGAGAFEVVGADGLVL